MTNGQSVGCGYHPSTAKTTAINNADDWLREFKNITANISICKDCGRIARVPDAWTITPQSEPSGSSDTSDSDKDTDSEDEALNLNKPDKNTT